MSFRSVLVIGLLVGVAAVGCPRTAEAGETADVAVRLVRDLDGPGTFDIYAWACPCSNGGISSYGLPIMGGFTSLEHESPVYEIAVSGGGSIYDPAGFSLMRTADDLSPAAAQDTINAPTPHLVYGMGQTVGSFDALGYDYVAGLLEQPEWGAPLLIATGTYDTGSQLPELDQSHVDFKVNVFEGFEGADVRAAVIMDAGLAGDGWPWPSPFESCGVPEPSSILLAGLAWFGFVHFSRRR